MFGSLKEKLGALAKKIASMGSDKEEEEEEPEAPPRPPEEEPRKVFKKPKAAAKAAGLGKKPEEPAKPAPVKPGGAAEPSKPVAPEKPVTGPGEAPGRVPVEIPAKRPEETPGKKPVEAPAKRPERPPEKQPEKEPVKRTWWGGKVEEKPPKEPERPGPEKPVDQGEDAFTEGIFGWKLKEGKLDDILEDLDIALLESDVALPVVDAIKRAVKKELVDRKVKFGTDIEGVVSEALRNAMLGVLSDKGQVSPKARKNPSRFEPPEFFTFIENKRKKVAGAEVAPVVLMFVGINGTGKTTTIAKMVHMLQKKGYSCVIGAGDTFRAGAIEQLEKHADKLGVKLIKHQAGSDPASVAYDAIEHGKARKRDIVLIDTAGRMQTDTGLMEEMSKIERVANPDLVVYVGDALAGNDAVNEAMSFNKAVGIDAVVLTKVDADAKGGAALSIRYTTGAPVIFVGTGQEYGDFQPFTPEWMVDRIFGN